MTRLGAIDTDALLDLVWAAPLAVFTVIIAWALVVLGVTRASEARRAGRAGAASLHLALAGVGGVLFTAAVVLGLIIMQSK